MASYAFAGQLNPNEIFSGIFNMIISQDVMVPELADNYNLVDKFRVDGTLYGDTKLYYAQDVLASRQWGADAEAANLLNINRPKDPKCQAITLDQFRQIDITVDNYLSKRAWSTEGAFSAFNSVVLAMLKQTKKLYDVTLFNTFVGTTKSAAKKATISIDLTTALTGLSGEEKSRMQAQLVAEELANIFTDMKDFSREYNDYKFMRAYSESDLMIIFNAEWVNKFTYVDLPTIFHNDKLANKLTDDILPARFFGETTTSADVGADKVIDATNHYAPTVGTLRSKIEKDVTVGGVVYHVFPGDELPYDAASSAYPTVGGNSANFKYAEVYKEDANIICKIVTKDTYKYMSAFETATEFFNPRSLTQNHYLTWGYSEPAYLFDKPLITLTSI